MAALDIIELFELQLSEIELLQSMFPSDGEFCLDDPSAVWDLRSYVDAAAEGSGLANYRLPDELSSCGDMTKRADTVTEADDSEGVVCLRQISFTLKVTVSPPQDEDVPRGFALELEVQCRLPLDYPKALPELNVQSSALSRSQYKALNGALRAHVEGLERGELCMMETVQWLQENAVEYCLVAGSVPDRDAEKSDGTGIASSSPCFTRLWIHSHHIYSRSKREDICAWARERELTGFSLPGKPGVVCIEGPRGDVDEFWHKLRRLNWKKLTSKHREDFTSEPTAGSGQPPGATLPFKRHFEGFQEINFAVRGSRDYHMDLGQFFQYLGSHGCADVFKILLGVDGRVSQKGTS